MAINTVKVTIQGQEYTLTYNGTSGKYEATIAAPSGSSYNNNAEHYFPVQVTATDMAGNAKTIDDTDGTLGSALKLRVKEKVKPTIAITGPSAGAYVATNTPTITAQLRDADSGIDISTFTLKIDSGANLVNGSPGMTVTPVAGGYNISYVPQVALSDAAHTITVNVSDFDGNIATVATSSFTVDTVPPVLNVTSPAQSLITNNPTLTVAGSTSDANGLTVTIKLNGVDQGAVTVAGGNFSKNITLTTQGANTIEVKSTDLAGKTTTVTRNITFDTIAPTISAVTITPNPVDAGQTFIISVTAVD